MSVIFNLLPAESVRCAVVCWYALSLQCSELNSGWRIDLHKNDLLLHCLETKKRKKNLIRIDLHYYYTIWRRRRKEKNLIREGERKCRLFLTTVLKKCCSESLSEQVTETSLMLQFCKVCPGVHVLESLYLVHFL